MMGKVAMGDLIFWLPETKVERIAFPTTFKDLIRLTSLLKFATFSACTKDYKENLVFEKVRVKTVC